MPATNLPLLIVLVAALAVVLMLIYRRITSAAPGQESRPVPPPSPEAAMPRSMPPRVRSSAAISSAVPLTGGINSWGYQLQDLDVANASASSVDLLVIDPTLDGSDDTRLKPADLARLKQKPDGKRRIVLAYLSIGEAESYRPYWDKSWKRDKPDWLLGENPDWKENYAVCFWKPGWQALMCGSPEASLDRIIAAGFDGVYLDKCDVFEDLKRRYKAEAKSRPDIEGDMVAFIARISAYAKARNPAFVVVMQNAEQLLERDDLRAVLDGIAKEELVYGCDGVEKLNKPADFNDTRENLDRMRADGKFVLVVEYLNDQNKILHARQVTGPLGYVLYISDKDRELKRLNDEPLVG